MNFPITLPIASLVGNYSKIKDEVLIRGKGVAVYQYSVVLQISSAETKLVTVYRRVTGAWVVDEAESEEKLYNEIRMMIDMYEGII